MTPEPALKQAFRAALQRMEVAHEALVANVCAETLLAFQCAVDECREAFDQMTRESFRIARVRWPR